MNTNSLGGSELLTVGMILETAVLFSYMDQLTTCRNHDCGTSVVSGSPSAPDLGRVDPVMVESPQTPPVLQLDPLLDSRIARRETVNGQTGIFFEYHYPEIVVPDYSPAGGSITDGSISVENPTSNLQQDLNPNDLGPRILIINGRVGLFYPDIIFHQVT